MNNKILDIYENKDGHLVLKVYNYTTGKVEALMRDEEVEVFLRKIEHYPVIEEKEEIRNNKEFDIVKYPGFNIQIHDMEYSGKKIQYLKPLFNSLQQYTEKNKLKDLSERPSSKRKVQRTNKYSNQRIMPAILTAVLLISAVTTVSAIGVDKTPQDAPYYNEIVTEAIEYESVNVGAFYEQLVGIEAIETETVQNVENIEITETKEPNSIALEYEDLSNTDKAIYTKENYGNIIEKYAHRYGLDANLILGIATQERGVHSTQKDKGGATGLMQIQNSVWLGQQISAYNFETGRYDKFTVTEDMIKNLNTNIQLGCMIFQNCLTYVDYNIPMAVQTYNFGIGNMKKVIDAYANMTDQTRKEVMSNQNDVGWMEYRDIINVGDTDYVNHVFSWMGEENNISVIKKDNTIVNLTISNNLEVNKTY